MSAPKKARSVFQDVDSLLLPFLAATSQEQEDRLLIQLLDQHVNPIVRHILQHKLRSYCLTAESYANQDIEEAYHEIQLHLLERLRNFKTQPDHNSVANLRSYVAATARNACESYLRRKFPQRRNLKDKIRYCLENRSHLVVWEEAGKVWYAGLASWDRQSNSGQHANTRSVAELLSSLTGVFSGVDTQRLGLDHLITTIFQATGSFLELDDLTTIVAELRRVEETRNIPFDMGDNPLSDQLASPQAGPDSIVEYHQLLEHLWNEIGLLPRRQRVVLLCNLKNEEGINVITLLPALRIATFEEIADVLEVPREEFEDLWRKLPIDDLTLAQYVGGTRQQIINLRRSARDRLLRRMKAFEANVTLRHVPVRSAS